MRTPGEIKREPRVDVSFDARLVDSTGIEHQVKVLDLSKSGFRLQSEEMFRIGERVHLKTKRRGDFPAQIRWALGHEAGGRFLDAIDLPD